MKALLPLWLLAHHVRWNAAGTSTSVDYAGFKRDRTRNRIAPLHVEVSMIFRWYGDDFMRVGGPIPD